MAQSVNSYDVQALVSPARPPNTWRAFADYSVFNRALPDSPTLYNDGTRTSASIISYLSAQTNPTTLGFNYGGSGNDYHHPLYFAKDTDDDCTLTILSDPAEGAPGNGHPNYGTSPFNGLAIKVPHDALPAGRYSGGAPLDDGHMHIVQPNGDLVTCYKVLTGWTDGGDFQCRIAAVVTLAGSGLTASDDEGSTAARFAGGPMMRAEEAAARNVAHALFGTTYRTRGMVYPATGAGSETVDTHAPPMGARLRYTKTIAQIDAESWPTWVKDFMKVLRRYGVFIADTGGASLATAALQFKIESDQVYRAYPGTYATPNPWEQFGIDNSVPSRASTLGGTVPSRTVYELVFATYSITVADFEVVAPSASMVTGDVMLLGAG